MSKTQLVNIGKELYYKSGQCTTMSNYSSVDVIVATTYVRLYTVYSDGKDITANSKLRVFYR